MKNADITFRSCWKPLLVVANLRPVQGMNLRGPRAERRATPVARLLPARCGEYDYDIRPEGLLPIAAFLTRRARRNSQGVSQAGAAIPSDLAADKPAARENSEISEAYEVLSDRRIGGSTIWAKSDGTVSQVLVPATLEAVAMPFGGSTGMRTFGRTPSGLNFAASTKISLAGGIGNPRDTRRTMRIARPKADRTPRTTTRPLSEAMTLKARSRSPSARSCTGRFIRFRCCGRTR